MLELIEGSDEEEAAHNSDFENNGADKNSESTPAQLQENASADSDPSDWREQIPDELAVDSSWEDIYPTSYSSATSFDTDSMDFESHNTVVDTLQDHLLWQLNLTPMSDSDRSIALALIDAIDVNGMLTVDIESIHSGFYPDAEIELDEVLTVLHRIQQFDPVGVGYRDLAECLLIQLNQFEESQETTAVRNARLIVSEHIALLGNRDYAQLMRRTRLKEADLRKAIKIIESLDPHPGANISPPATSYIVPDVIVSKQADIGKWKIELNPDTTPKLRINDSYASLVKRADSSAENNYLKDNLQEARWFIKSLQSRNETLMKVSTRIVEHQRGFLEYGEEAMKPLVLRDIAEAVGMHESTISRVTTQKYMHTPRGIFELKYFFSSHVSTKGGGECSSTAIRAIIKKFIAAENARRPLSDSKITKLLDEKGINVARRTIAKYRESLSIPPSNERKRLID
jgi:RNA polymerase sigma-54 factor